MPPNPVKHIIHCQVLPDYRLELRFDDGVHGTVDLSELVRQEAFAPWRDYQNFKQTRIEKGRRLVWEGDIDLCADALYLEVTGKQAADIFPALKPEPAHA